MDERTEVGPVIAEEVFGPVLTVSEVDSVDDAFAAVNASRFGLRTGVFTHDVRTAFRAHRELDVGGVIIGDVPGYRADQMPYGGLKESGAGREGVRSAMSDYCDERVLVLSDLELWGLARGPRGHGSTNRMSCRGRDPADGFGL